MLFNSLQFIFLFLPFTLAGYYLLIRAGLRDWIFLFLVCASLVFYAVWNPPYVLLLVGSVGMNYLFGRWLGALRAAGRGMAWVLGAGIVLNVAVLFWFNMPISSSTTSTQPPARTTTSSVSCCRWRFPSTRCSRSPSWWMSRAARSRPKASGAT